MTGSQNPKGPVKPSQTELPNCRGSRNISGPPGLSHAFFSLEFCFPSFSTCLLLPMVENGHLQIGAFDSIPGDSLPLFPASNFKSPAGSLTHLVWVRCLLLDQATLTSGVKSYSTPCVVREVFPRGSGGFTGHTEQVGVHGPCLRL